MEHFEFYSPVKIIAGKYALNKLCFVLQESLGVKKPILVTDAGLKTAGVVEKVEKLLRRTYSDLEVFYEVPPDSSLKVVMDIYRLFVAAGCDGVVALGGGSVIDTAKGLVLVVSAEGKDISDLQGVDVIRKRSVPFVVIPTTCGTGSEVSRVAVIEDRERNKKLAFASDALFPDATFLDRDAIETLPGNLVAATSMDALTHAIEAYVSVQKNPVSDAFALTAAKEIFLNAVDGAKGDVNAKCKLLVASTCAGMAFSNSMVGMVHSVSHAVGGVAGVPHGVANAILLPHVMRFNMGRDERTAFLYGEMFRYLMIFSHAVAGKNLVDAVECLMDTLHKIASLPRRLRDVGVDKEQFEEIAKQAVLDGSAVFNPVAFEEEDVMAVLEEAF